jgi:hypothetical protein
MWRGVDWEAVADMADISREVDTALRADSAGKT